MDFKITPVSLDRINTGDHTYRITTKTEKDELALSISAIGLLQPPVLMKNRHGYTVVCGFRRIQACTSLNIAKIPARILDAHYPKIACAQMAISDNSSQRLLNIVEQSRAYALVSRFADRSTAWRGIVESAGLASNQTAIDRILPVAGMPDALQDAILEGSIALPVALSINRLKTDDARILCNFFKQVGAGLNIQRELLALVSDISLRDDIPIAMLLEQSDLTDIMCNADFSNPQKVQYLRMNLKAKRYPELSKAEASFKQELKALDLNPRVQINPPQFFEGTSYRLCLRIDSRRQLKFLQSELDKLVGHPNLLPE